MLIEVKNLEKVYGAAHEYQIKALDGISFAVREGEFIGIMGASGSGKSTLLNILAANDTPTAGQVKYEGQDITLLDKNALARFRVCLAAKRFHYPIRAAAVIQYSGS